MADFLRTDDVAEADRFTQWRHWISATFVPLECAQVRREPFRGEVGHRGLGDMLVSRVEADPHLAARTRRMIALRDVGYYKVGAAHQGLVPSVPGGSPGPAAPHRGVGDRRVPGRGRAPVRGQDPAVPARVPRGDRPLRAVPGLRGQLVRHRCHARRGRRNAHLTRPPAIPECVPPRRAKLRDQEPPRPVVLALICAEPSAGRPAAGPGTSDRGGPMTDTATKPDPNSPPAQHAPLPHTAADAVRETPFTPLAWRSAPRRSAPTRGSTNPDWSWPGTCAGRAGWTRSPMG